MARGATGAAGLQGRAGRQDDERLPSDNPICLWGGCIVAAEEARPRWRGSSVSRCYTAGSGAVCRAHCTAHRFPGGTRGVLWTGVNTNAPPGGCSGPIAVDDDQVLAASVGAATRRTSTGLRSEAADKRARDVGKKLDRLVGAAGLARLHRRPGARGVATGKAPANVNAESGQRYLGSSAIASWAGWHGVARTARTAPSDR